MGDLNDTGHLNPPPLSKRASGWAVWLGILALLVGGCWALADTDEPAPAGSYSAASSEGDASARMACSHFRNIAADAVDGILGGDQVLPKLREVNQSASVSEVVAVRTAARNMLRDATQGYDPTAGITAMGDACRSIGQ